MNCQEAQNLLSAYHDGELAEEQAAIIAKHVASCNECAARLAGFEQLSRMSRELDQPFVPATIWDALSDNLDDLSVVKSPRPWSWLQSRATLCVAVAALLLVGAFGIVSLWPWSTDIEHEHLAANFDAYLHEFPVDPMQAQQVLLVNYDGQRVTIDEAASTLGYAPLAGVKTPQGYSIQDVYLLKMPCCKCAQVLYRSSDGRLIAVFEHEKDQPIWFGDRPAITCQCGGKSTNLVQVDGQLAATWKLGARYVTLIGAKSLEEVQSLIGQLSQAS